MEKHSWTEADDITALYAYRFGTDRLGISVPELARSRDIPPGSFDMRMRNFGAIRGEGNLTHVAQQSRRIFAKYGDTSEESLRKLLLLSR
jgi:hypothetical protein